MSFIVNDNHEHETNGTLVTIVVDERKQISYLRFYDANTFEKNTF